MKSPVVHSLLIFYFSITQLPAQFTLTGTITPSPGYENKLYIARIDQIGFTVPVLIDSVLLDPSGSFSYTLEPDPQDLLYQVILPMKSHLYRQALSSLRDNYFLVTFDGNRKDILKVTAAADSLYYSVRYQGSKLNQKLLAYRDVKKPLGNLFRQMTDSIQAKPNEADRIKSRYLPLIFQEIEILKPKLVAILDTCRTPVLVAAGIYNLFEASLGNLKAEEITGFTRLLPDHSALLIQNLKQNKLAGAKLKAEGLTLPNTQLPDYRGKTVSLSDIQGEHKVLYFWASWCGPCRKANKTYLPMLFTEWKKHTIPLIGISIDEDAQKWKLAVKTDNTPWTQLHDNEGLLKKIIDIGGVPYYVVLNKDNTILFETFVHFEVEHFLKNRTGSNKKNRKIQDTSIKTQD
jgi:peroxiredoxin